MVAVIKHQLALTLARMDFNEGRKRFEATSPRQTAYFMRGKA